MICFKCHANNSEENTFCQQCGAPFSAVTENLIQAGGNFQEPLPQPPPPAIWYNAAAENLSGRLLDGKYQLEAKLGAGGVGAVYLAARLHIGDKVAVKVLRSDRGEDAQAVERFRLEARMAAHLKHPNAVAIYDYGVTADGLRYLVMELVEGRTLRQLISQQGALPVSLVAEINAQACAALDEAHRIGLVHRDIKPDNIIVRETPSGLRVKILDFGIAKLSSLGASNLTQTGTIVGTPRYMSPEQCMGEQLDGRSDIYSLGIVLYEMLCGIVPFNAPSSTAIAIQQVTHPPPPLRQINPNLSPAVESVVLRTLEKKREARPASAAELAEEFNAAAGNQWQSKPSAATVYRAAQTNETPQIATASGNQPTVSMPSQTGDPQFFQPGFLAAGQATSNNRKNAPLFIAAAFLGVLLFGGIGAAAVWLWLRQPTESGFKNQNKISNSISANSGNSTGKNTTNVNSASSANPADEELTRLRNERLGSSPEETDKIAEKLEAAEKKYPNDYRFPFERALLVAASTNHHPTYSALSEAVRVALKNNQAEQMLNDLARYKNADFRRVSRGHSEWTQIENALRRKNENLLPKDEHH